MFDGKWVKVKEEIQEWRAGSLPNRDMVLTCEGPCTTRATWNDGPFEVVPLVALANDAWAICVSSAGNFGVQRKERFGHEGEKDQA